MMDTCNQFYCRACEDIDLIYCDECGGGYCNTDTRRCFENMIEVVVDGNDVRCCEGCCPENYTVE